MIQISGSSDREIIDLQQGDYEELDQMNAAKPYAKAAFRVNKPEDIGIGVARAIHAAVSGRPGGVYLDLTAEVLSTALDSAAGTKSLVQGANTLDFGRDIMDMRLPRKRLDSGTWGVMGIGLGYAIGAAVVSGKPVVAIEGDSAFGFSGMEIETICRYHLPVVIVVFNNGGIYRGNDINRGGGSDPAPTVLMKNARYDKLIEAFGGTGHHVVDPQGLTKALTDALAAGGPALINCVIDPTVGTESGHLQNLNPQSRIGNAR
jgi:thiamine pyrophosphate-dependent acetolactate synthase large subunit-like protein